MKEYVKLDDLTQLATLEDLIAESKAAIKEWYNNALETEGGNRNAALLRLVRCVACGTLQTALDFAAKKQEEECRSITLVEMADRICGSPCFISMIGWVVGEKIMTDDLDIREDDDEQTD